MLAYNGWHQFFFSGQYFKKNVPFDPYQKNNQTIFESADFRRAIAINFFCTILVPLSQYNAEF
jgi:hypothetical protein